jgi:protease YdgD
MRRKALLMAVLAVACCRAAADPVPADALRRRLPGIVGEDDRVPLDSGAWPWRAIGRLNQPNGGYCTGVLIASDAVLTAAHCLMDRRAGRWLAAGDLAFVAGYRRDEDAGFARGRAFLRPEGYAPIAGKVAEDWAVIYLERPLPVRPVPVRALPPPGKDGLRQVHLQRAGYGQDRPHLLSIDDGCGVRGELDGGRVLLSDCDGTHGDSGSPLLLREGESAWVVGVLSSVAASGGKAGNYVVHASAFLPYLRKEPGFTGLVDEK